ncbi:hypothetical protein BH11MYX4_BH11MYX4_68340 [soil metagenome]
MVFRSYADQPMKPEATLVRVAIRFCAGTGDQQENT